MWSRNLQIFNKAIGLTINIIEKEYMRSLSSSIKPSRHNSHNRQNKSSLASQVKEKIILDTNDHIIPSSNKTTGEYNIVESHGRTTTTTTTTYGHGIENTTTADSSIFQENAAENNNNIIVNKSQIEEIRLGSRYTLFKLLRNNNAEAHANNNKLVILMPWVLAKYETVEKYRNLYHSQGYDVFTIQCHPGMVLWVPLGLSYGKEALDVMLASEEIQSRDKIMLHAISGGVYLYHAMWLELFKDFEKYGSIAERITGQIYDSGIYSGKTATANTVARIIFDRYPLQRKLADKLLRKWYDIMAPYSSDLLQDCRDKFVERGKAPCLFLNSFDDNKVDLKAIDAFVEELESSGFIVVNHKWECSMHSAHFKEHPMEYEGLVRKFMTSCEF